MRHSQSFSNEVVDELLDVMNYDLVSVEQLACMTNIDLTYLTNAFNKSVSLTLDDVEAICLALEISPAETLGGIHY